MALSIKNLIASILIAVSGFLFWNEVLPTYGQTSNLKTGMAKRSELLSARTAIIKKIEDLNRERSDRYGELQRLALITPESKNLPEIISMIEAMFSRTGNILGDFTIGDASSPGEALKRVFLEVSSRGSYNSSLNLLADIEKNIRIFDITSITIAEDPRFQDTGVLNFQIRGDVYWLDQEALVSEQSSADRVRSGKELN